MNYTESLNYIHSLPRFKNNLSFEPILKVLSLASNPQNKLNYVHIAGTNGKGSTAVMIKSALEVSNKKTGLYISPFVTEFCERIQINGDYISKFDLCFYTELFKKNIDKNNLSLSEFEFITCIAFKYFYDNNCDIVVLETGLGGRFDATNVIKKPLVSVLTKIDIDHIGVLGEKVEEIAFEKCGIIKDNSVVVTTENQTDSVKKIIEKSALENNSKLYYNNLGNITNKSVSLNGNAFLLNNNLYSTKLLGEHQFDNAATAIKTLKILGVDDESIKKGLKKASINCRVEVLSKNPLFIVDGSHNNNGISALVNTLNTLNIFNFNILLCIMKDKQVEESIKNIVAKANKVFVTEIPENPRCIDAKELNNICKKYNQNTEIICLNNFKSILNSSMPTVALGSLYSASFIINNFNKT